MSSDPIATGDAVLRCFEDVAKEMRSTDAIGHSKSAGFITVPQRDGTLRKFQVFVELTEYSEELLKSDPHSGGLLKYKGEKRPETPKPKGKTKK